MWSRGRESSYMSDMARKRAFRIGRSRVSRAPVVKRILVPLDFSGYSNAALSWALTFAEQFGARVVLLYVAVMFRAVLRSPLAAYLRAGLSYLYIERLRLVAGL